jgi:hypothetical protein
VPQNDIQPNWGPAFGAQPVQNPYVADNVPPWMNGWFGMPQWGMDPFGNPLTQEQMMYQRPAQFDQNMQAQQAPPPGPQQNPFRSGYSPVQGGLTEADFAIGNQVAQQMGYDQAVAHGYKPDYEMSLWPGSEQAYNRFKSFGVGGKDGAG